MIRETMDAVKEKWRTLLLLPFIVVVHNTSHNAVFWKWNRLEMYKVPTLPDAIMSYTPIHDDVAILEYDTIRLSLFIFIFASCMFTVLCSGSMKHAVFSANHFIVVYSVASVLRCITFFVTVLPGTAPYCIDPSLGGTYSPERAPQSIQDIFLRFDWNHGCGDLLFSGHVILTMCAFLTVQELSLYFFLRIGTILALPFFLVMTVLARKHYSIDVLVAVYITPLLWYALKKNFLLSKSKAKKKKKMETQVV